MVPLLVEVYTVLVSYASLNSLCSGVSVLLLNWYNSLLLLSLSSLSILQNITFDQFSHCINLPFIENALHVATD